MSEPKNKDPDCRFLKLSEYVSDFLSGPEPWDQYSCRPISKQKAEIIEILTKGTYICHIQWESHEGTRLQKPILWNYKAWREDCDSWLTARRKRDEERIVEAILEKNIKTLALVLQYETALMHNQCLIVARKQLKATTVENIMFKFNDTFKELRSKLITTKEEL